MSSSNVQKSMTRETRSLVAGVLLLIGLVALGWLSAQLLRDQSLLPVDDFVGYWGGARLLIMGNNPYSDEDLFALQRSVGWQEDARLMMWNPPHTLTLMLPFAPLDYPLARLLWLFVSLGMIWGCGEWLWAHYGGDSRQRGLGAILALIFFPSLFALRLGQISPLLLLGLVGFLYFAHRERWFQAGLFVPLLIIKVHISYLFGWVLLLWVIRQRCWSLVAGAAVVLLATTAIPVLINPNVPAWYLEMLSEGVLARHSPLTFGAFFRYLFGLEHLWLQFLPSIVGAVGYTGYWWKRREGWNWSAELPLLLLLSMLTTSFGWAFDQIILLPAILQGAATLYRSGQRERLYGSALLYIVLNAIALVMNIQEIYIFWYLWMAPAWLLLYLFVMRDRPSTPSLSSI